MLAQPTAQRCQEPLARADPLPLDSLLQPCAAAVNVPETTALSVVDRCQSDAAHYRTVASRPPIRIKQQHWPRLAVATVAHRARSSTRFLTAEQVENSTDVLPCAVIIQSLALRHIGGVPPEVDIVLVHSDWLPEQLATAAAYGIKLRQGSVPPTEQYSSEFEAANMLKVEVAGLTEYEHERRVQQCPHSPHCMCTLLAMACGLTVPTTGMSAYSTLTWIWCRVSKSRSISNGSMTKD